MSAQPQAGRYSYSVPTGVAMCAAFGVALSLAIAVCAIFGTGERGLFIGLRATARWSFLLFWPAYALGTFPTLFGPRFIPLAANVRKFGLAYASAHLVHAGLITWLYQIATEPPVPRSSLIFFGIGLFWTYLLALLSIDRVFRFVGARPGRLLRQIGSHYIMLAFLLDFAKAPFKPDLGFQVLYLPFWSLALAGMVLRVAAASFRAWTSLRAATGRVRPVAEH